MRFTAKFVLPHALALLLVGSAPAQRSVPPGAAQVTPQQSFPAPLYRTPEVARTLDLTPSQIDRLNAAVDKLQDRYRTQYGRLRNLSAVERARTVDRLERDYRTDLNRSYSGVFNQKQMGRYRQLELQSRGFDAFLDPTVQRQLSLTAGQLRQLRTLAVQTDRQLRQLRPLPGQADQAQRQRAEIRAQALGSVNDLLTPQQRQVWTGLVGQRFNFPPATQPPPR